MLRGATEVCAYLSDPPYSSPLGFTWDTVTDRVSVSVGHFAFFVFYFSHSDPLRIGVLQKIATSSCAIPRAL